LTTQPWIDFKTDQKKSTSWIAPYVVFISAGHTLTT